MALSFAKAAEICLVQVIFAPYKSTCDASVDISQQIETAKKDPKREKKITRLLTFLESGQHLDLGSMAHLLRLCNGRTAGKEYLIGSLSSFIREKLHGTTFLDPNLVDPIGLIAKERNPGTHSDILSKAKAAECRRLCLDILQGLEPCIAEYVNGLRRN